MANDNDISLINKSLMIENDEYINQLKQENSYYESYLELINNTNGSYDMFADLDNELSDFVELCDILKVENPNLKSSILEKASIYMDDVEKAIADANRFKVNNDAIKTFYNDISKQQKSFNDYKQQIDRGLSNAQERINNDWNKNSIMAEKCAKKAIKINKELQNANVSDNFSLETLILFDNEIEECDLKIDELLEELKCYKGFPLDRKDAQLLVEKKKEELRNIDESMVKKTNLASWTNIL